MQSQVHSAENQLDQVHPTMKSQLVKPLSIDAQLARIRMTATERLDAKASLQQGEVLADLILTAARHLRQAGEDVSQFFRRAGQGLCRLGKSHR